MAPTGAGKGLMTWLIDFDGYTLKNAPSLKVCWTAAPRTAGLCPVALALACLETLHARCSSVRDSCVQRSYSFYWLLPALGPGLLSLAVCWGAVLAHSTSPRRTRSS